MKDKYFAIVNGTFAVPMILVANSYMDEIMEDGAKAGVTSVPVYFSDDGRFWPRCANNVIVTKSFGVEG